MKVLISGAGIAGPTLAFWLAHYGFKPTIVEAAPACAPAAIFIDFWGAGFDIADRMGLLPEIFGQGYKDQRSASGKPGAEETHQRVCSGRVFPGDPGPVCRPAANRDVASAIFGKIEGRVETIFGDSLDRIDQTESGVQGEVRKRRRSGVGSRGGSRRTSFPGAPVGFWDEKALREISGIQSRSLRGEGIQPRDELVNVMYTEVGQQVAASPCMTTALCSCLCSRMTIPAGADSLQAQKALLRTRFGSSGWECPQILEALDNGQRFLFRSGKPDTNGSAAGTVDKGSGNTGRRRRLPASRCWRVRARPWPWWRRIFLPANCIAPTVTTPQAFRRYQDLFGPFVLRKQKAALRFAGVFAPKSKFSMFLRNQIFKLLAIPWIADRAVGRDFADHIALHNY